MKDDVFIFHLILMYSELWVCDVIESGMEGVHSEFHYELLGFKKSHG